MARDLYLYHTHGSGTMSVLVWTSVLVWLAHVDAQRAPIIPTAVEIAPGVKMPFVNLGGVHSHPSNYTAWLSLGGMGLDTCANLSASPCAHIASNFARVYIDSQPLFTQSSNDRIPRACSALMYGDDVQVTVGSAIKAVQVPREELFVTSKVPCCPELNDWTGWCSWYDKEYTDLDAYTRAEIDVRLLGLEYVDLMLLHWPCATMEETVRTYRALEKFAQAGRARSIGISNFNASAIEGLYAAGLTVPPAINQCGFSIGNHNHSLLGRDLATLAKCREKGITYSAYSPLGGLSGIDVLSDPRVKRIGAAHNKSSAQTACAPHACFTTKRPRLTTRPPNCCH